MKFIGPLIGLGEAGYGAYTGQPSYVVGGLGSAATTGAAALQNQPQTGITPPPRSSFQAVSPDAGSSFATPYPASYGGVQPPGAGALSQYGTAQPTNTLIQQAVQQALGGQSPNPLAIYEQAA
jgi:hypothetical protein